MKEPKLFCVWHRHARRVAVNLRGARLENLSEEDARNMVGMLHEQVREQVEVRPMSDAYSVN